MMFKYLFNKSILIEYFDADNPDITYSKYKLHNYTNQEIINFINIYIDELKNTKYFYKRYLFILCRQREFDKLKHNYAGIKQNNKEIRKILKKMDVSTIINKRLFNFYDKTYIKYFKKKYFSLLKIYDKIIYYDNCFKYKKKYFFKKLKNNYEFIDNYDLKFFYFKNNYLILKYKLYYKLSNDIILFIFKYKK